MKIACSNCNHDIEIITMEPSPAAAAGERHGICEYCKASYTIRPKIGHEGFDIIFETDKRVVRICINCGKKFYAVPSEAIPVCSACQASTVPLAETPSMAYHVIKVSGKRIGPLALDQLGMMVNAGTLGERDTIEGPGGIKSKAIDLPELAFYFRDFFSKTKSRGKTAPGGIIDVSGSPFISRWTWIIMMLLSACLVLWGIKVYRLSERAPEVQDPIAKLAQSWAVPGSDITRSAEEYLNSGVDKLKAYTELSCSEAKSDFIKAFLAGKGSTSPLPWIALSLNCLFEHQRDERLIDLSINISDLAIERDPLDPIAYLAKGDSLLKQGSLNDAGQLTGKAISIRPEEPVIMALHAQSLLAVPAKWVEAESLLEESIRKDPRLLLSYLLLARHYCSTLDFYKARDLLRARNALQPEDSETLMLAVRLDLLSKRYAEAKKGLERIARLSPSDAKARILLAQLSYSAFGNSGSARAIVESLLGDPGPLSQTETADAYLLLSSLDMDSGRAKPALEETEKALLIRPTDLDAKFSKIRALAALKKFEDASRLLEEFILGEKDYPTYFNLKIGNFLEQKKLGMESLDHYARYINNEPVSFLPFVKIASSLFARGEANQASRVLLDGMDRTFLLLNSDFSPEIKGTVLRYDPAAAGRELKKSSSAASNPDLIDAARGVLLAQGELMDRAPSGLDSARGILERVVKKDSSIRQAWAWLGFIHLRKGNLARAEELLKRAQEMDINNLGLKLALGMVYSREGETDLVYRYLKEPLETQGWTSYLARFERTRMELKGKEREKALEDLKALYREKGDYLPVITKLFDPKDQR